MFVYNCLYDDCFVSFLIVSEVLQWKAEKVRTPAKRGRKPGTGKKNMIKGATGKIILVTVDLSKFENGDILFQVS